MTATITNLYTRIRNTLGVPTDPLPSQTTAFTLSSAVVIARLTHRIAELEAQAKTLLHQHHSPALRTEREQRLNALKNLHFALGYEDGQETARKVERVYLQKGGGKKGRIEELEEAGGVSEEKKTEILVLLGMLSTEFDEFEERRVWMWRKREGGAAK